MATVTVGATSAPVDWVGKRGDIWGPIQFAAQTPFDLSGRTWVAQVRASKDRPSEVIAEMVVDDSDAASGVIRVSILPSQSTNLATGPSVNPDWPEGKATYYWDVEGTPLDNPEGTKTWFGGKIKVDGDVSGAF